MGCAHYQSTKISRHASTPSEKHISPYSSTSRYSRCYSREKLPTGWFYFLRITKVYATETYDYPTAIQESISELSTTIGHGLTNFAAANLKGTSLPAPAPAAPVAQQHKTLPHALGRAATTAANTLQGTPGAAEDKLTKAIAGYASAWERISDARVTQDDSIRTNFLQPWQQTLSTSINVAMKARQAVRLSRLELDAAKQTSVPINSFL